MRWVFDKNKEFAMVLVTQIQIWVFES